MRALVVYETLWGNTGQIARAIATGLSNTMSVEVVDSDAAPKVVDDYDLVVVGGPTHAFSMTRSSTRENAVSQHGAPSSPTKGIREWLVEVTPPSSAIPAATFDTRVDRPRMPGSAAKAAKKELRELGFVIAIKQESFRVHGYEGPLLDGEQGRAERWGLELGQAIAAR